ncbi:MAG: hypothetical protein AUJ72_02610 [Candidatus Omnitrophica bacterium CG1_02_46_14]|nr:MAG: hypothetical protein AUJ72_02610 [Candidatus Omnitrophica bacterium CG1_02_46_14]
MMKKMIFWMLIALGFQPLTALAETIVAHETEKYFFSGGEMKKFEGQHENTYYLDTNKWTLTRTRIYDYQTKKITPDETVYQVETSLRSHPTKSMLFGLPPVIRGVGRPDKDSVEIVTIEDDTVTTSTSTAGNFTIARAKRLK